MDTTQERRISVVGPFTVKKGTGGILEAMECLECRHKKLQGPAARLDVCFSQGGKSRNIKFRAEVSSIISLSGLFHITDVGPMDLDRSRILLYGGTVRGIGKFQFAVLEITNSNPGDGKGTITFYTGQDVTQYQQPSDVEFRITAVEAKNTAERIDILLRGNSLVIRGFHAPDRFDHAQFWLRSIHEIIEKLEALKKPGGPKEFFAHAVFFGNDQSEGRILFKVDANTDFVNVYFQELFNTEVRRTSDPIQVSLTKLLREMRRTQEILMLLYGWL